MNAESRKTRRLSVSIPAAVYLKEKPNQRIEAEIKNISEGGAFVHCTAPIKIGQEVLLEIRFGETRIISGVVVDMEDQLKNEPASDTREKSVIRWVRGSSSAGFGVEFLETHKDKKKFVTMLFNYFETLKKAGVSFTEDDLESEGE